MKINLLSKHSIDPKTFQTLTYVSKYFRILLANICPHRLLTFDLQRYISVELPLFRITYECTLLKMN
ncbi:unnamed protein product [Heterobilharzia americana]|nr:unnamed protein product [Heterobilharzia americana]